MKKAKPQRSLSKIRPIKPNHTHDSHIFFTDPDEKCKSHYKSHKKCTLAQYHHIQNGTKISPYRASPFTHKPLSINYSWLWACNTSSHVEKSRQQASGITGFLPKQNGKKGWKYLFFKKICAIFWMNLKSRNTIKMFILRKFWQSSAKISL